jgi:hypothetical protein
VKEVSKYVVKGNELAKWPAEHTTEFVHAVRGRRFFFTFGTLFKLQSEIRREINRAKPPGLICECGCSEFIYRSELDQTVHDIKHDCRR